MSPAKPANLVQLGGRLGNLLFEVAFGVGLAKRTGLPTRYLGNLDPPVRLALETWTSTVAWADEKERTKLVGGPGLRGKLVRSVQRWLPAQGRRFVLQNSPEYQSWHLKVLGPTYWSGYWQSGRYFENAEDEIRAAFVFNGSLSKRLLEARELADMPHSVAVHVRRGDYLTTAGFAVLDHSYYRRALAALSPAGPVLVFSDDPDWCRENLDWPVSFQVVHGGSSEEDLYLMSLCHHHIIAHSTFSWWGAWLGRRNGRTLAPDLWFPSFGKVPDLTHIYPPSWERIPIGENDIR